MLAVLASNLPGLNSFHRMLLIILVPVFFIGGSLWHLYLGAFPSLEGGHDSLIYFREIAKRTESRFIEERSSQSDDGYAKDVLSQVWRNSEILRQKFNHISSAFNWMAVAILPWVECLVFLSVHYPSKIGRTSSLEALTLMLKQELESVGWKIFHDDHWIIREGQVVPDPEDLRLGSDGVNLDATVLYADMSGSTRLVDTKKAPFAAEVYKTYLACAAKIIKNEGARRVDPVVTSQPNAPPQSEQEDISASELNSEVELLNSQYLLQKVLLETGLREKPTRRLWFGKADEKATIAQAVRRLAKRLKIEPLRQRRGHPGIRRRRAAGHRRGRSRLSAERSVPPGCGFDSRGAPAPACPLARYAGWA